MKKAESKSKSASKKAFSNVPKLNLSKEQVREWLDQVAEGRGHMETYQIVMRPEPEGGYTVMVPSLPGCVTYGKNAEEARKMANDAIRAYIASLNKHDEPIPPSDTESLISSITVPRY